MTPSRSIVGRRRKRTGRGAVMAALVLFAVAGSSCTGGARREKLTDILSQAMATRGVDAAVDEYRARRDQGFAGVRENEADTNSLGYRLLRGGDPAGAIRILQLNVETHPRSSNAYDSLAEAYLAAGQKDLAVQNYEKALALNPKQRSAAAALARLAGRKRQPHSPLVLLHILAGTLGLLAGGGAMVLRKGSPRHAAAGKVFVVAMLSMSASGAFLAFTATRPETTNVLMGLLTFYLVATSWRTARRTETRTGPFDWTALLLVSGVVAGLATYGWRTAAGDGGEGFPAALYFVFGTVALLAAAGDVRQMWRGGGLTGAPRVARHLWRMCLALFIGAASLFLGQPQVFPEALRRSGLLAVPPLLVLVLLVYWMVRVRVGHTYKKYVTAGAAAGARSEGGTLVSGLVRDVRFAFQSLRRSPGFTFVAVVTLALGIGANTSAFSILNGVLLRPLPYPDSRELDIIVRSTAQSSRGRIAPADYLDVKSARQGYGEIAAYGASEMILSEPGRPAEMERGLRVSADLLSVLGIVPQLGRAFRADEEVRGHHRVLLLSHRYWQNHFGGDDRIVGRVVRVDGEPHEIVGVLPASLNDWRHLGAYDLFRPLGFSEQEKTDRTSTTFRLVGRRSRALTRAQADGFIADFGRRLASDFPDAHAGTAWRALPIYDTVSPPGSQGILGMLVGLSLFVLLIACSNLANLLLARTMARARELAVRAALGASQIRLLRPLFAEALVLALIGGACAIPVALSTHRWLNSLAALEKGDPLVFALDGRVLAWTFAACLVTALAFAVVPALFALRLDLNRTLKSGSRGNSGDRGHRRFRELLIAGQFTFAMVLLAGAVVFVRGLHEWNNRHFGWESAELVTGSLLLPAATYSTEKEIGEFQRLALARVAALPGVASASLSYLMPFFGLSEPRKYVVAGHDAPQRGHEPVAATNGVSPRYFETVGTPVLSGRAFTEADTLTAPKVFIINQAMARGLFGGENPLGRRLARAGGGSLEWGEIVGVAGDTESVASNQLAAPYQIYQPMAQAPRPRAELAVRARGIEPSALVTGIRATMMSLDPDLPVRDLQPAAVTIAPAANYQSVIRSLLSFLALLGLGLASLGIYGVVARATAQRTGEFGIRLALGAQAADITRLVLTSGARLALLGSAIGVVGAFGLTRLIVAAFPGLQTSSAPVVAGVTVLLLAIAQIACYVPARAAARTNPTEALRAE